MLIQLLHGNNKELGLLDNSRGSQAARARAAIALHNIVHSNPDSKRGRREARVLRLLEQIRAHCDQLMGSSSDEVVRSTTVPGENQMRHYDVMAYYSIPEKIYQNITTHEFQDVL